MNDYLNRITDTLQTDVPMTSSNMSITSPNMFESTIEDMNTNLPAITGTGEQVNTDGTQLSQRNAAYLKPRKVSIRRYELKK